MKYAYYPGCSLDSTAKEYDRSLRAVCHELDIELVELKGWICCGTSGVHTISRASGAALSLVNLSLVRSAGFDQVVVPCEACFSRFRTTQYECGHDPALAEEARALAATGNTADSEADLEIKVIHPLELFQEEGHWKALRRQVKRDLSGLAIACYYGCLLTRPAKVMHFDACEYPMSMDRILRQIGVETIDWSFKTDCCGGSLMLSRTDLALPLIRDILENAVALGADALAVACPLCHASLDMRQTQMNQALGTAYEVPILYFTQLMGLACGIPAEKLEFKKHMVNPMPLLEAKGRAGRHKVSVKGSVGG